MIYNKITLAFPEKEEKLFREKYFSDSLFQVRVSFVAVIFLYGIFGVLDKLMVPEYTRVFYIIRYAVVIPLFSIVLLLSFTKIFRKIWQDLLFISTIVGGSGIIVMIMLAPENFAYYSGMMLIFSAAYFLIKLRFLAATIAGWMLLLIYNFGAAIYAHAPNMILINTNFFFISANVIGMFAAYNIEYYARRNFSLNLELDSEKLHVEEINKNLGKTVLQRTNELFLAKEIAETNNAKVTAIIEGTQNSIWAFDKNYEILYINPTFQSEFQQSFGKWLEQGTNFIKSLPEATRPKWKARYDKVLNNEQFTIEDSVKTEAGMIYIQVSFNPIINNGEVVGGSCFGNNITHRKLSEIELQRAKAQAEESDSLKTAFLQNMSHEIRTPLNAISGFSGILNKPNLSEEKRKNFTSIIQNNSKQLVSIVTDILTISSLETGQEETNIEEVSINSVIHDLAVIFKEQAQNQNISLQAKRQLNDKEAEIYTDRTKIIQILSNLLTNALKFTREGFIEFGYNFKTTLDEPGKAEHSEMEFYVKDSGIGIKTEKQERIFERFRQASENINKEYGGTGLGLAISKAFVELLGGKIWVQSEVNKGSTFYFTIPYKPVNKMGEIPLPK